MQEIRISKFVLLLKDRNPCRVVVKSRVPVWSCLPWPTRYKTYSSVSLPAGTWDMDHYSCSFPEPIRVPLPEECSRVKVKLMDASRTIATFKASMAETCCHTKNTSHAMLYYQVGLVGAATHTLDDIVFEGEAEFDVKCGTPPLSDIPSLSDTTDGKDNVLGAHAEDPHLQEDDLYNQTSSRVCIGEEDHLLHQSENQSSENAESSDDSSDDLIGQSDLSSEDEEYLLYEPNSEKIVLTDKMVHQLAVRMYEADCLMPEYETSFTYHQFLWYLGLVAIALCLLYYFFGTGQEEDDEPLIDL